MTSFVLRGFAGMRPLADPRLLNASEAQYSLNARLQSGALMPYKTNGATSVVLGRTPLSDVKRIYPVLNNTKWLSWTTEADVVESPIIDDQYNRIYWSGDGAPKYGPVSFITTGAAPYPSAHYSLGVPTPAGKPSAAGVAITEATTNTREYAVTFLNAAGNKESSLGTNAQTTCLVSHYDYGQYSATLSVSGTTVTVGFPYSHSFANEDWIKVGGVAAAFDVTEVVDAKTIRFDRGAVAISPGSVTVSKRVLARTKLSSLPSSSLSQPSVTQKRLYRKIAGTYKLLATLPLNQDAYTDDALDSEVAGAAVENAVLYTPSRPSFAPSASREISDTSIEDNPASATVQRVYAATWVHSSGYESPMSESSGFLTVIDGVTSVKVAHGDTPPSGVTKKRIYRQDVSTSGAGTYSLSQSGYRLLVECPASQTIYIDKSAQSVITSRAAPTNQDGISPPTSFFAAVGSVQPTRNAETRSYVYTYVSAYGEEGPPSEPSETVDIDTEFSVTVTGLSGAPGGNYNISKIYLYRTAVGASGGTSFQFVKELDVGVGNFVDTVAQTALGEIIPSTDWTAPPSDMQGMRMMANGVVIGWSQEKTMCFSEPFLPHAFPAKYRFPVDHAVVGIGVFGQSAVVVTKGYPQIISGVSPESMTSSKVPLEQACVSKRSIVETGNGVMYASPDGLVSVGAGGASVATQGVLSQDQWQAYNPETIHGYWHESRYHGFCTVGGAVKCFIFDPSGATATWCETDVVAYAGHRAIQDDKLFVLSPTAVESLFGGTGKRTYTWKSKIAVVPSPSNLGFAQVVASSYPVTLKVIADGISKTYSAANSNPFRLEAGFLAREWCIEVTGTADITTVALAQSAWELKNV